MFENIPLTSEAIVTFGAAIVAVLSLAINFSMSRRHQRISAEALRVDVDAHLLAWADEVLDVMGLASQLVETQPLNGAGRSDILRELSVLLDRGRWHAPNAPDANHGAEKPAAYQGHRQPVLDCIYAVHAIVDGVEHENERDPRRESEDIQAARRGFVSEVQILTDPRRRREFAQRAAASKAVRKRMNG